MPASAAATAAPPATTALLIGGIGAHVSVEVDGPLADAVLRSLTRVWARCLGTPHGPVGEALRLSPQLSEEPGHLLAGITQQVTRALIAAQAGRLLMLHAGAVCHPETGRSLVYVAGGGTGKTTLTRVLARHYGYLTDETVAIDADHRVLPYPKPLSVRRADAEWPKREHSPDDLGLLNPPDVATVGRLVLLERDDGIGDEPDVTELALLDAIAAIAPHTSSLYALPTGLRRCAELVEATGPVLRVRYAEAESLRGLAAELIGAPA